MSEAFKVERGGHKPVSFTSIKELEGNDLLSKFSQMREMFVLEYPDGINITLKFHNDQAKPEEQRIEIVTKPHRGLTSDMIKRVSDIIKRTPDLTYIFSTIPIKELYVHTVFFGGEFSVEAEYSGEGFSIMAFEFNSKIAEKGIYDKIIEDASLQMFAAPVLFRGAPDMRKVNELASQSVLSHNGEGVRCAVVCSPIYHPDDEELMYFKVTT